jgi:O-methyltransferase/methyltransferase family protein
VKTQADTHREMWRLLTQLRISRAIGAAVQLGIPKFLARHPHTAAQLAADTGAHEPSVRRLLHLLVAIRVLSEDESGRFALTDLGDELREDNLGPLARFFVSEHEWAAWGRLDHSVRTGGRAFDLIYGMRNWEFYSKHPAEAAVFDAAMQAITRPVAEGVATGYDFSTIGSIVDVGGGDGTMLIGILRHHPNVRGILFDRPHVIERARARFEEAGLAERVELIGGSFFEEMPAGADAYHMKSILHDWEDHDAVAILKRCRVAATANDARLLVVERLLSERIGPDDLDSLLSDLNMLVLPGGRERTAAEYAGLFKEAGFQLRRTLPIGPQFHILEGAPI